MRGAFGFALSAAARFAAYAEQSADDEGGGPIVIKVIQPPEGENREKESGYRSEPEIQRAPVFNECRDKDDDGDKGENKEHSLFNFVLKNFKRHIELPFAFFGVFSARHNNHGPQQGISFH